MAERQFSLPSQKQVLLRGLIPAILILVFIALAAVPGRTAPYAELVMDARTGEILRSRNADARLHPASLTKMMTLYIAFEAVEKGEISLDSLVTVSANAASEPPSKLGLRTGQRIKLRYLIRAAAVKSANDAATAIGEAIEGSESAFAARMNRTAKALGMTKSHFVNANGLTANGHLSSARDMGTMGRHLFFDYPEYYNIFSRRSTDAGGTTVYNTNRKFLAAYRGADGIKTGYTRASGFNLVASAERGNVRIIGVVFGGQSTPWRNKRMAELLDIGFQRAPARARTIKPPKPNYAPTDPLLMAGKSRNMVRAPETSLRPMARPVTEPVLVAAVADEPIGEGDQDVPPTAEEQAESIVSKEVLLAALQTPAAPARPLAPASAYSRIKPVARPSDLLAQFPKASPANTNAAPAVAVAVAPVAPPATPAAAQVAPVAVAEPELVTRMSATTDTDWGVNVGRFGSQGAAERVLLTTALSEVETLEGADRAVVRGKTGYDATFTGLTREAADRTCQRMNARNMTCFMIGPDT